MTAPTLQVEHELLAAGATVVCGVDEVGRGAIAGPVCVGAVCIDVTTPDLPGVRDSKLLTASARERLVEPIRDWAVAWALGWASAAEVDELGIVGALRHAGHAALTALAEQGVRPDIVLLDGRHDWLSAPAATLLDAIDDAATSAVHVPRVLTRVKADLSCLSVAAASVLAKVERDARMVALAQEFPDYGWDGNKGYGSPGHQVALRERGLTREHRRSWRLLDTD